MYFVTFRVTYLKCAFSADAYDRHFEGCDELLFGRAGYVCGALNSLQLEKWHRPREGSRAVLFGLRFNE